MTTQRGLGQAPSGEPRVVLVTGAASGIGRAVAERRAALGDAVVAVDRDETRLRDVVGSIATGGGTATAIAADLADPAEARRIVEATVDHYGRLDAVALVAGIGQYGPAAAISVEEWDRVLAVNLRAPFLIAQAALPHLVGTHGAIVAVTSIAGEQGWPYAAAYAASKGGLITAMRTLAIEYGPAGVRVNLVAPGSVETGMSAGMRTPDFEYDESVRKRSLGLEGRRADPSEIADVIGFLLSPAASFVNGAVLRADGGAFA